MNKLQIHFQGSFQCRLATDPQPASASPKEHGPGSGWTFAYSEPTFDRKIRLSKPVALRTGLIDPWQDTKVSSVLVDRGHGPMPDPRSGLAGTVVSLGDAIFDSHAGAGTTREALLTFAFSIGKVFKADATKPPKSPGVTVTTSWVSEYKLKKPARISSAVLDPKRKAYLAKLWPIDTYASFFQMDGAYPAIKLKNVKISTKTGILATIPDPKKYQWTLQFRFFRFDGDTLAGQITGDLSAAKAP